MTCNIANVPEEELDEFVPMFFDALNRVIEEESIDMDRMKTIILREKLKLLNNIETNSHFSAAITCIGDFLYGKEDGSDLEAACQDLKYLDQLLKYSSDDWVRLLEKYEDITSGSAHNILYLLIILHCFKMVHQKPSHHSFGKAV